MLRYITVLALLALALVGCTLTTVPQADDTVTPTSISQNPTSTPTRTPTPSPTPTATNTRVPPPTITNCTPRYDWPFYIVVAGDTLSSIASRTNSSVSQLVQANCLSNPNIINPGQQLRVPRQPVPDTEIGSIEVSPFIYAEGGSYTVQPNTAITVRWPQARRDASRIEFYASPFNSNSPLTILGTDNIASDGASIVVTFPAGFQQAVYATAFFSGGSRQRTANRIPVFAENAPPPDVPVVFQPNLGKDGNVTLLPPGTITASWPSPVVAQASHIEFTFIRNGTQREFLGRDVNLSDGAQITWQGGDAGPTGTHQFEAVAFRNSGILAVSTVSIRFQVVDQVQGDVLIQPIIRNEGDVRIVEAGRTVNLIWQNAPVGQSPQFEFTLYEDGVVGPHSLGIDTNGSDGVSVQWTVPFAINNGRIVASARIPNQTGGTIRSRESRVRPEAINPGPSGQLSIAPNGGMEGGWLKLQAGTTVTITWVAVPTSSVQSVEFYLSPTGTGSTPSLIGTDTNFGDGVTTTWAVPGSLSGYISAIAFTADGREIIPANNELQILAE
ncbi:MAG: hypothetical protein CL610_29775 [Anaerolineaceae bacterium]|nr:hypothetical protein [Anaerolineaceae bacterium]